MRQINKPILKAIVLLTLIAIALGLRLYQLTSVSFWFDEACSWRISQMNLRETFAAISRDAHPPLYYFVCKLWIFFFGDTTLAARSLSLFFGIATIFAAIWFCHESCQRKIAPSALISFSSMAAVVLIGINASQIELSQEARPYTLGAFLSIAAACLLLRALRKMTIAAWSLLTVTNVLLSFTHYYCLFTVGAIYLFLGVEIYLSFLESRVHGWQLLRLSAASLWLVQLAWLPWWSTFVHQLSRANKQLWMEPFSWNQFVQVCARAMGVSSESNQSLIFTCIAFTIWVTVGLIGVFSKERNCRLLGMLALFPLLMTIAYSMTTRSIVGDRYLLFSQTSLLILLAQLFRLSKKHFLGTMLVFGFMVWSLGWTFHSMDHRHYLAKFPGTKSAVEYVNQERDEQTVLIINSPFVQTICVHYLTTTANVYTVSASDFRANILSGPALREVDLLPQDFFSSNPETIWTIDTLGLFDRSFVTDLPLRYEVVAEKRFAERYHFRMDYIVRKYKLNSVP